MSKQYKLIVSDRYSLSNETDYDVQSDYFPGIWSIKSKKSVLEFAKRLIAEGNIITQVTDYDNPKYHKAANEIIQELGLNQPLFQEAKPLVQGTVINDKPKTLSELKRYLAVDTKIHIANYDYTGALRAERDTFVKRVQTNSVVLDKAGGNSWLEFGKASEWVFSNDSASKFYLEREGQFVLSSKLTY